MSEEDLKQLDGITSPLLRKSQSLHHIYIYHADEVMKSERTLYKYVNNGLFSARNLDMPKTVRMRPRKTKPAALKIDRSCRINRTYGDYKSFLEKNPDTPVCQLDSVEGIRGGPIFLMVHFVRQELQFAFLRKSNDSRSVTDIFERLYFKMGPDIFMNVFPCSLQITAVNSQTQKQSNLTDRVAAEHVCFTAMQILLTRKETAKTIMK